MPVCKPNSVCPPRRRRGRRARGARSSIYGRPSPAASSGLPALQRWKRAFRWAALSGAAPVQCCWALRPVGFARPRASPRTPVRSYRTLAPLPVPVGCRQPASHRRSAFCGTSRRFHEGHAFRRPCLRASAFPLGSTAPCGVRTFLTAASKSWRFWKRGAMRRPARRGWWKVEGSLEGPLHPSTLNLKPSCPRRFPRRVLCRR